MVVNIKSNYKVHVFIELMDLVILLKNSTYFMFFENSIIPEIITMLLILLNSIKYSSTI